MVTANAEVDEQVAPPDSQAAITPESDSASIPSVQAEAEGGSAEGQEVATQEKAPPDDATLLQEALTARAAFNRGTSDELKLNAQQRRLLQSHDDRQISNARRDEQARAEYEAHIAGINKAWDDAPAAMMTSLLDLIDELGYSRDQLTVSQTRMIDQVVKEGIAPLREAAGRAMLPLEAAVRKEVVDTAVALGVGQQAAFRAYQNMPLITDDPVNKPSLLSETYRLGYQHGQGAKVGDGMVVKSQADFEKEIAKARDEGRNEVQANGSRVPVGGGARPVNTLNLSLKQIDDMPTSEWMALGDQATRQKILDAAHERAARGR